MIFNGERHEVCDITQLTIVRPAAHKHLLLSIGSRQLNQLWLNIQTYEPVLSPGWSDRNANRREES